MHADPIKWSDVRLRVLIGGESIRGVSRADGLSRNTVRKMLRQDQPARYVRRRSQTSLSSHEQSIDAILLADEARPQCQRRNIAAIFRLLRDHHGYIGSYGSVARYCRRVRVPQINFLVRPAGAVGAIDSLTIVRAPRAYRLDLNARKGTADIAMSLHRDRWTERAAEVANWIDQLRGDRLELPPRGDPDVIDRLLGCVHDGVGVDPV